MRDFLIAVGVLIMTGIGGGIALWVLQKPKVELVSIPESAWCYTYYENVEVSGTEVLLGVVVQNNGSEATNIDARFEAVIGAQQIVLTLDDTIPIEGKGSRKEVAMTFSLPKQRGYPKDGEAIDGLLTLRVWGNHRLIFGQRTLQKRVTIPCVQGYRIKKAFGR